MFIPFFPVIVSIGSWFRIRASLQKCLDSLMKQFGYKALTREVKRQIFGWNAAGVYSVDPKAKRNPDPGDYIDQLKKLYRQAGGPMPSNTQYGWVAAV